VIRLSITIRLRSNATVSRNVFVSVFSFNTFMSNNAVFINKNIELKFSKPTPASIMMFANREVRNKLKINDKLILPVNGILSEVLTILSIEYPGRKLQIRIEGMSLNHDHGWISLQFEASSICLGLINSIDIDIA